MVWHKATEEQATNIKDLADKATSKLRAAPSRAFEELTKHHAQNCVLRKKGVVVKHREELKKAAEAAPIKAKESAPAPAATYSTRAKAAIDSAVVAAISTKEVEQRTKHQMAIEKAVEIGRLEDTMNLGLKDTQPTRLYAA